MIFYGSVNSTTIINWFSDMSVGLNLTVRSRGRLPLDILIPTGEADCICGLGRKEIKACCKHRIFSLGHES